VTVGVLNPLGYLNLAGDYSSGSYPVWNMVRQTSPTGAMTFRYRNDDIDALTGFSLEIDPLWIQPHMEK